MAGGVPSGATKSPSINWAWTAYPITNGYSTAQIPGNGDSPHYAVDLATPTGTPITALFPGTVTVSDDAVWNGRSGGGEIFIKPDDPKIPTYYFYHLDMRNVTVGQHVYAGYTIGTSGGQNSGGHTNTDPMWSSGPHLHVGFFQKFMDTPIGSRPFGPDITGTLKDFASGQNPSGVPQVTIEQLHKQEDSGCAPWDIGCIIGNLAGPVGGLLARVGLFLLGLAILVVGGIILIHPSPANLVPGVKAVKSL